MRNKKNTFEIIALALLLLFVFTNSISYTGFTIHELTSQTYQNIQPYTKYILIGAIVALSLLTIAYSSRKKPILKQHQKETIKKFTTILAFILSATILLVLITLTTKYYTNILVFLQIIISNIITRYIALGIIIALLVLYITKPKKRLSTQKIHNKRIAIRKIRNTTFIIIATILLIAIIKAMTTIDWTQFITNYQLPDLIRDTIILIIVIAIIKEIIKIKNPKIHKKNIYKNLQNIIIILIAAIDILGIYFLTKIIIQNKIIFNLTTLTQAPLQIKLAIIALILLVPISIIYIIKIIRKA